MRDLNALYYKLRYMKKNRPQMYRIFAKSKGICVRCGTTVDVDVFKEEDMVVSCTSCHLIHEEAKKRGLTIESYSRQRQEIIDEIIERISGSSAPIVCGVDKRNQEMYRLFLNGRSYAHIGDIYNLSRERVRQVIKSMK